MQKNYKNKFEKYFKKKFGQKNWKGGGAKKIWSLFRDRHTHTSPLYIDHHHHGRAGGQVHREEPRADDEVDQTPENRPT